MLSYWKNLNSQEFLKGPPVPGNSTRFLDTSKQAIGMLFIHFANVYLSDLTEEDPCSLWVCLCMSVSFRHSVCLSLCLCIFVYVVNINAICKVLVSWAEIRSHKCSIRTNCVRKFGCIPVSQHSGGISISWFNSVLSHNATDFKGACSWHADCRNVQQSCIAVLENVMLISLP